MVAKKRKLIHFNNDGEKCTYSYIYIYVELILRIMPMMMVRSRGRMHGWHKSKTTRCGTITHIDKENNPVLAFRMQKLNKDCNNNQDKDEDKYDDDNVNNGKRKKERKNQTKKQRRTK